MNFYNYKQDTKRFFYLLLQSLPDSPDLVHKGMVHNKSRVEGREVQSAHGVDSTTTKTRVDPVVGNLKLNLKVAERRLLQGKQNLKLEYPKDLKFWKSEKNLDLDDS